MENIRISIRNLSVRYRIVREKPATFQEYIINYLRGKRIKTEDFWALNNVTLEVKEGESFGIIGHNGAGKSTLLRVICGIIKPCKGEVVVNGSIAPLIQLGAGFDKELTGKENIYLNASILGFSRKEIEKKYDSILEFSELDEFIYTPLKHYSSGMVARLGFTIATEVDPDILIIDEVLGVGDARFKKKSKQRIIQFRERGKTIILVSHSMEEIKNLCDRVLWLDHGQVRMFGIPGEVTEEYIKFMEKDPIMKKKLLKKQNNGLFS